MDSKDPDVHALDGWMPATKTYPHAPSTKTECDYPNGWIKKKKKKKKKDGRIRKKNSPKMVNPRNLARERRRRK